ncbi:MAG TPA: glycosyltransferase, partial [Blastocatellia bacterium]|nr:glycosyltransferase [Blastocatellia bacterium]
LGMGHLVRSMALARGLSRRFRVVFLNGGPLPKGVKLPASVEVIHLPPLGLDADGKLVSRDRRRTVERAQELRRKAILATYRDLRPQAVLIELFPFGRKKFAGELMPMLEAARDASPARPIVACSLRDILVGRRDDQQKHDERAVQVANNYFDAIFVHADPALARLDESFHPHTKLTTPIHYTGYVSPEREPRHAADDIRRRRIVVSAGGGLVGYPLLQAAIEAHALLEDDEFEMRVIAGPFLPEAQWQTLRTAAQGRRGIRLLRTVPDLCAEMRAAASLSQCGYNTALDILQSGTAALVVPFAKGSEDEQTKRAERLERLGAVRVLNPAQLSASRLADELRGLLDFKPRPHCLDLSGAQHSVRILSELMRSRRPGRSLDSSIARAARETHQ